MGKKIPTETNTGLTCESSASLLTTSVKLTEQVWPENIVPMVSIFCLTYNHEKFICEAIEGVLMQETTFPVEILIHDDASTDQTKEMLLYYTNKYPKIIKIVIQTENQWSKSGSKVSWEYLLKLKGKYIAFCEGDDFWTDPLKLQKQITYLRDNPQSILCHHVVSYLNNEEGINISEEPSTKYRIDKIDPRNFIEGNFINNCSVLIKKEALHNYNKCNLNLKMGDYPIWVYSAQHGDIGYINENMATYRIHQGGYWSSLNDEVRCKAHKEMVEKIIWVLDAGNRAPWLNKYIHNLECEAGNANTFYSLCKIRIKQFLLKVYSGHLNKYVK